MKVASFAFSTPNLGDDLQVMATIRHLPWVNRLVNRDAMVDDRFADKHTVVMNSWFQLGRRYPNFPLLRRRNLAPSDSYAPIFHGFCLGSDKILRKGWEGYLRSQDEPIGCRDIGTTERLKGLGIEAYWSGCLTLTLGHNLREVPASARKGIYFVDLPEQVEKEFIPAEISSRATRLSNDPPKAILKDPLARMAYMARLCDRLRHAELVVTRRLHTALPCVAFGTPVIVLVETAPNNTRRFSGFDSFVPVHFYGGGATPRKIDWNDRTPARLPGALQENVARLQNKIRERLGSNPEQTYENMAQRTRLTLPNPGLGAPTGEVAIDLGVCAVNRMPLGWSDKEIVLELDHFAGFDRFNSRILARRPGGQWVEAGTIAGAIASQS